MARSSLPVNLNIGNQQKFLSLISQRELKNLVAKYQTDAFVSKLFTVNLLKLYLITFLNFTKLTLRDICSLSHQMSIQALSGLGPIKLATLSKRNKKLDYRLFQDLFELLRSKVTTRLLVKNPLLRETQKLQIFDSTFIRLSLKLLPWSLPHQNGQGTFKIGLRIQDQCDIPEQVLIQVDSTNENNLFRDFIDFSKKGTTYLFDRGFYIIEVLRDIMASGNFFITRCHPQYAIECLTVLRSELTKNSKHYWYLKEQWVLIGGKNNQSSEPLRHITVRTREGNRILTFITNRIDLTAEEVADLYLKRWQIETLFKWFKQALKMDKLISRSFNGVMIQIYIVLILQVLLTLFQQTTQKKFPYRKALLREIQNQFQDHLCWWYFQLGRASCQNKNKISSMHQLKRYVKKQSITGRH